MSVTPGLYSLYYATRSHVSEDDVGHEDHFDSMVDALSRAFHVSQQNGRVTHLIYDDAVLFSGEELDELLKQITVNNNGQPGDLAQGITRTLPEALIKQLAKTVKFSHEYFGAVAVYREMLEDLYSGSGQCDSEKGS